MKDHLSKIIIYTDGACSGNPGPGGFGAVIVYPEGKVKELGGGSFKTTNNKMEMTAALEALKTVYNSKRKEEVLLLTDSTYLIRGITEWIWGWRKRDWKNSEGNEVSNKETWKALSPLSEKLKITWGYVRGHNNVPGNERCDEIAVAFSKKQYVELYEGSLLNYPVAVHDIPSDLSLPPPKDHSKSKKKPAYSYVSLVSGKFETHKTWAECEARVKGRSGARFKKALSPEEEKAIIKEWS